MHYLPVTVINQNPLDRTETCSVSKTLKSVRNQIGHR